MIRKHDELFCHQAVSTFDRPATSAREWTERAWMMAHSIRGVGHLAVGLGYYPNRNVMDAFACFTIGEQRLHIVRASRELRPDIDVTRVGPLAYDVVEPLRKVRFTCGENEYGLAFDVTFEGVSPLHEEVAQQQLVRGREKEHIKRMVQAGRPHGWIRADGQTFQLDDTWVAERDRSWGIRVAGADFIEAGVQPPEMYDGQLFNFVLMQFPNWGATFHVREIWDDGVGRPRRWHFGGGIFYPYGTDREALELADVEHHYELDNSRPEQQRRFAGGRVVLRAVDGTTREVAIRPVSICYQAPGGYGWMYKGFIHGLWMGPQWMDGYRLDVTNSEVMREIWGYCDYGSEFRCGGEVGHGTTELMVVGKYPRYGYQSY